MLKKAKIRVAAWGLTGLIGAGSLFSGMAAQNVYAEEPAEVNVTETVTEDSGVLNESPVEVPAGTDAAEESSPVEETGEQQDVTDVTNVTEVKTEDDADITPGSETKTTGGVGEIKVKGNTNTKTNDTEATREVKNGWVKEKGGYKYYKDGKAYTGWHKMGKAEGEKTAHWCYFGKNGVMYTGWKKMGKAEGEKTAHWCYFGSNGWMRTGWVQFGKGTSEPDGNTKKHWCYFGDNGWMRTGWQTMGTKNNPDGKSGKHMSYFGSNGWMRTGWVQFGKGTSEPDGNTKKHWCYFGDNGWMRTGWQTMGTKNNPDGKSGKHTSYFGSNGWMRTGWVQFGKGTSEPDGNTPKHWSYFGENGWMRTGWQDMGKGTKNPDGNSAKHKSFFGSNGWMRTGNHLIGKYIHSFSNNGWLKDAIYEGNNRFTGEMRIRIGSSYAYYYYKNGIIFTGNGNELPKNLESIYYEYDSNGIIKNKSNSKKVNNSSFFAGGKPVSVLEIRYSDKNINTKVVDGIEGVEFTYKIGNDVYKAKTGKNGYLKIDLKDNYKFGTKYDVTVSYGGRKVTLNREVGEFINLFQNLTCKACKNYVKGKLAKAVAGDEIILADSRGGRYSKIVSYSSSSYSFSFTTRYTAQNYSWFSFTVKDKYGRVRDTNFWNLKW